jgi:hypothetical protein
MFFLHNNYYISAKESFIREFEPMNREFTDEEVKIFKLNEKTCFSLPRRWTYNPYIHGDDEQAWRN